MNNSISGLPPELAGLELKQPEKKANDELGQSEFLDLMIAQLQHQDPLNPADSGEFLGQLAQFGTVNGITELQNSFADLATSLQSSQALQASTLVGRNVLIPGNVVNFAGGSGAVCDSGIRSHSECRGCPVHTGAVQGGKRQPGPGRTGTVAES